MAGMSDTELSLICIALFACGFLADIALRYSIKRYGYIHTAIFAGIAVFIVPMIGLASWFI